MYLTYDTQKSALETLDTFRDLNKSMNLRFQAQLWRKVNGEAEAGHPPSPSLELHLGFHGTLEDVHRLFKGWSHEIQPTHVRLGEPLYCTVSEDLSELLHT